jgi:hypothetical protein
MTAPATAPAPERATTVATPERRRPGARARVGPYARLIIDGVLALLGLVVCVVAVVVCGWLLVKVVTRASDTLEFGAMLLALAAGCLWPGVTAARFLLRLPGRFAATRRLLDDASPAQVKLTVRADRSFRRPRYTARIIGPHGERLDLRLSGPGWLLREATHKVLCYGWPPPGPYVLEFSDGRLALVEPD